MRVTNSMLISDMLWNANQNLNRMSDYQNQLSSGKAIQKPSDDPVGTTRVLKYKSDIRAAEQYSDNISSATGWLEVTESSITTVKEILQRVRELAVGAANGTNTTEDTQKTASEVSALVDELIVLGNSTNAGKYIFSGMQTDEKLFNEDGSFNIDMTSQRLSELDTKSYEIAAGVVIDVGVHPSELFGYVDANNFFANYTAFSNAETGVATQGTLKADVNLDYDYTADTLDLTIDGTLYDVDESVLEDTPMNPMTKERFVQALKSADSGSGTLGDVADVYFDGNGQLVVQSKTYGSATTIADSTSSAGFTGVTITAGTDGTDTTITGTSTITDADIAAETGTHSLVITYNGISAKLDIDFSTLNTAADLQTEIQSQLDAAFPPGGDVTVSAVSGGTIDFTVAGTNDGMTSTLSTDYIVSTESQLISDLQTFIGYLNTGDQAGMQTSLGDLDTHLDNVLSVLGEIGGLNNRLSFSSERTEDNILSFTSLLSEVYDVDMAETIMYFKNLESVYRASLSVGGQVIQPTLVDFIS